MRPAFGLSSEVVQRLNAKLPGFGDSLNRRFREIGQYIEADAGHRGVIQYDGALKVEQNTVTGVSKPEDNYGAVDFGTLQAWSTPERLAAIVTECVELDEIIEDDVQVVGTTILPFVVAFSIFNPMNTTGGAGIASANDIGVWEWLLPAQITVASFTWELTVAAAGQLLSIGLYNSAGSLVINSTPQSTTTIGVKNVAITPVTLTPGFYYLAYTCNSATPRFRAPAYTGQMFTLYNENRDRSGKTGTSSGAVLPSTMGSITPNTIGPPLVLLES